MDAAEDSPFIELGNLLKAWRSQKYRSALAFYNAGKDKFSFSYGLYATYERGEAQAPVQVLEEVAAFLGIDPLPGILMWLLPQIGSLPLRERVSAVLGRPLERRKVEMVEKYHGRLDSHVIPDREFENTWMLDVPERKLIEAQPWLIDFIIHLAMVAPEALPFSRLGLESDAAVKQFVKSYLQRWVDDEKILVTRQGFKLGKRYIHFPKSEAWEKIRMRMLDEALGSLIPQLTPEALAQGEVHRTIMSRLLTPEQRREFAVRLAALEREFYLQHQPAGDGAPTEICTLVTLFGPRGLDYRSQLSKRK